MTRKEITDAFNSLSLDARKEYLEALKAESKTQYDKFIKDLGDQAVQDFWDNERELIKQGKGTRDWTIEQQQTIMNIGKNGEELTHAKAPTDVNGKTYEGQHMFSKNEYPEYAGDYRNIQGLTFDEHRKGAHGNGVHKRPHRAIMTKYLNKCMILHLEVSIQDIHLKLILRNLQMELHQ